MGKIRDSIRQLRMPRGRVWKFIDDYSGAPFYSSQAVTDYKGFKTVAQFVDKWDPRIDLDVEGRFFEDTPEWTRPRPADVSADGNGEDELGQ